MGYLLECHLGVLNFLCIFQYSSWCNHVMWLIGNSLPCCHGDQVVTGVPLHVTVATWWSCQSGTQPTRIQTCNSRAWTCIWFHNTNTIWIPQLCCVKSFKSFHVGQNPSPILMLVTRMWIPAVCIDTRRYLYTKHDTWYQWLNCINSCTKPSI